MVVFETERLYLREMAQEDYGNLSEILQDEEVMYAYEHAFNDEEVQDWLDKQRKRYKKDGFGLWAIIHKETGAFIGQAGLTMQDVEGTPELEIGYLLKRKFWHQGFATEAAVGCKEYAFRVLNKHRVVSIIRDTNKSSQRVAERNGMSVEKTFVKHYYNMDMPHFVYSIHKNA
ncbi:GNAT family N-acetyltransferase [Bacillus sp. 1P06AnD]|uniref:GNAT family N-acetyltransferase n=1 Tax=Bacillus sp. 1P06AnD TaxID=3132208 RepID=UPI00399FD2E3